jgi:RimJ/RimL family protein N-acetyltransferase
MRHSHVIVGEAFRLRPITEQDAEFVVALRSMAGRSQYLNPISPSVDAQLRWLDDYFKRAGDYYFVIERIVGDRPEGLISLYDVASEEGAAEWGRWIVAPSSLAAIESVVLLMDFAFGTLGLRQVYSCTVAENNATNSFHDGCGFRRAGVQVGRFTMEGRAVDAVRHECASADWTVLRPALAAKRNKISQRINRDAPGR